MTDLSNFDLQRALGWVLLLSSILAAILYRDLVWDRKEKPTQLPGWNSAERQWLRTKMERLR